ncbi:MAG: hypothetical protein ABIQ18_48505 [Umezawaea sp.]
MNAPTTTPCPHEAQMQWLVATSDSRARRGASVAQMKSLSLLGQEVMDRCRAECGTDPADPAPEETQTDQWDVVAGAGQGLTGDDAR